MATVTLSGLKKSFGPVTVLHGLDLAIDDGEMVVVVGPSGCGKSTLLRLVAGLEEASAGTIAIDGHVVNRLEPKDRDIAMVFQNYALYPHMTVFRNMAYGLSIRGLSKAAIAERVAEAARILALDEALLSRLPRQLSGGQRQRVAMGRAIVRHPKLFLFDEPLSNLDAKLRVQMRLEIRELQRRLATTSLYVTHDQVEAMTLADRLVVMNAGVAEQIGPPLDLYRRPATVFVAGFIGSPAMNFLSARVAEGALALEGGGRLPVPDIARPDDGRALAVGIRPEHLAIAGDGIADLWLRVQLVEPLGADTLVHGVLADSGQPLRLRIDGARPARAGDRLALSVDGAALHLFDAESGRRLD